jgi:hypothetical protein
MFFINQKKNTDNFLSKEMLINNNNFEFKKIEKLNRETFKDVDELMMKSKHGDTIYDVTTV